MNKIEQLKEFKESCSSIMEGWGPGVDDYFRSLIYFNEKSFELIVEMDKRIKELERDKEIPAEMRRNGEL